MPLLVKKLVQIGKTSKGIIIPKGLVRGRNYVAIYVYTKEEEDRLTQDAKV